MTSEYHELPISNNSLINTIILSSGSSLIDMLTQQSCQTIDDDDPPSIISDENTKPIHKQTQNSQSNPEDNQILSLKNNDNITEHDKLATLFNTTGRERNSTGPLKQWLYEHQNHPYPDENDKQELIKKTQMSASQITIWFTNARVKMRKEKKLRLTLHKKKKNEKQQQDYLEENIELSMLFDDEIFQSTIDSIIHSNTKPIVMVHSCLNSEQITDLRRLVSIYPNQLSISDHVNNQTTHLIIGNELKPLLCPLTKKLFQSIACHLYIISYRWISDCLKQNDIIDENNYEIRGDNPFGEYHDGMKKSRLSKQTKLFENCQFFILCDGCQDKMSKDELTALIELCHGSLLHTFPLTTYSDNSVMTIVLCKELLPFESSNQQQLFELSRSNGVHFLGPEWILESIVHFALQPLDFYEEKF